MTDRVYARPRADQLTKDEELFGDHFSEILICFLFAAHNRIGTIRKAQCECNPAKA